MNSQSKKHKILKLYFFITILFHIDVGAGTGILSLFCFKAGAKKVYAVEASPMANFLKDTVIANGAQEVIEVCLFSVL